MKITGIPLRVPKSKKKLISLNINNYRNIHYLLNNKIKKYICKLVVEKCRGKTCPKPPLEFIYTIYRPNKRKIDLSNVLSIVDKFVADGIVKAGLIPDDNIDYIKKVTYLDGGIDRINPRCDLEIIRYMEADMIVDFYECEICQESIYEEYCKERAIGGDFITICEYCLKKMIK